MIARRDFLKVSGLVGGGLLLEGFLRRAIANGESVLSSEEAVGPFFHFKIHEDNTFALVMANHEMGQGTSSSLAAPFADELGVDWDQLSIEEATWNAGSKERHIGLFGANTGGSSGTRLVWESMRKAGAAMREMLVQAAANRWGVTADALTTRNGFVVESAGPRRISFASLAPKAAALSVPESPAFRPASELRYTGKRMPNLRAKELVSGKTDYSIDARPEGLVYAVIERCPYFGGTLVSFDDTETRGSPGVIDVFAIEGKTMENPRSTSKAGVVIIADSTWNAIKGREVLKVEWDGGENSDIDMNQFAKDFFAKPDDERGPVQDRRGNVRELIESADSVFEVEYASGYQAHACMEPLNSTARFSNGKLEIWVSTQSVPNQTSAIKQATGIQESDITIHVKPSGGSFGRRYYTDFVVESAMVAQKVNAPVKITWTREDDIQHDHFHAFHLFKYRVPLDENRRPLGLLAGGTGGNPYGWDALSIQRYQFPPALQIGAWRSVGAHYHAFATESFIDEFAHHLGRDPLDYRLERLRSRDLSSVPDNNRFAIERMIRVLEVAGEKANWGKRMPSGSGQGIAVARFGNSLCAHVVEVAAEGDQVELKKVTTAIDAGRVLNPQMAEGQIEGSIIWSYTALQHGVIDVVGGRVQQSNFHDFPLANIGETPEMEIHILESEGPIGGFGEPAVPPFAPAMLNAIYAASGKRIRTIPMDWGVLT